MGDGRVIRFRSEVQEIYERPGTKAASAEGAGAINQEEVGHVGSAGCRSAVAPPLLLPVCLSGFSFGLVFFSIFLCPQVDSLAELMLGLSKMFHFFPFPLPGSVQLPVSPPNEFLFSLLENVSRLFK